MTFKEYIEQLQRFAKENPETLEMNVITAKDPEGNGYNDIIFHPCVGVYEDGAFQIDELAEYGYSEDDINAVCVN